MFTVRLNRATVATLSCARDRYISRIWFLWQTDRHPFNGLFSRTTWLSWHHGTRKVQSMWI